MNSVIVLLKTFDFKKTSQSLVIFGVVMQLCLWVIPGTIALRQILLALTLLPSIFLLRGYLRFLTSHRHQLIPTLLLLCLIIWVATHLIFFSYDFELELKQFTSLWLRAIVGIIIGFTLGFTLRISSKRSALFFVALFATSLINLAIYIFQSHIQGVWIAPNSFVTTYYFNKIEAAYFGGIAIAISAAQILLKIKQKLTLRSCVVLFFWGVGIVVALLSSLVSSSKNGIAIGIYLCLMLIIGISYQSFFSKANRFKLSIVVILFFIVTCAIWNAHKSSASYGWGTLFQDIKIAVQIDKYPQWRSNTGLPYPINDEGNLVAGNTYQRISWATVGVTLIAKHPLGYGLINDSFKKMLDLDGVDHNVPGQVHSGWIDFGLAYGIPGVLLLFSCLLALLVLGLRAKDEFCFMATWLALMLIPFCLIAEMSYKQYFESMLFFVALGCSWLASTGIEKRLPR